MSETLLSPSWYRVAQLRPRLRGHTRFHRHRYRGQLWYVLQDRASGRSHRLTPAAYQIAGLMNGERSVQEIWEAAHTRLGDDGPTQDETIRLLGLLHFADVLQCDVPPDTLELLRRRQRREQGEWWQRFANPLAVRIPLVDPDAFLERWRWLARPLFSWPALAIWALVVGGATLLALAHLRELTEGASRELLDPRNLLLLWIAFPLLKALHELGHGFATKVWGGEVHEMGILFLVFMPIPYVDASAASVFPDKWKRVLVGSAGIVVELFVASLALFLWLGAEPGLLRSLAYNLIWIGGTSALLFNGNPLLRFDGYYVLADAIEMPNLGARSNQYVGYLVLRHLFGMQKVRYPVNAPGEQPWLLGYAVAAFCYRLFVLLAIALFVAGKFFGLGLVLAAFAVASQVLLPLVRHTAFVLANPRVGSQRPRALAVSGAVVGSLLLLLLVVPFPLLTRAEGVVWPPEGAQVRAGADGFVVALLAEPDARVRAGDPLIRTRDPSLEAEVEILEARVAQLEARHQSERGADRVRAQITREEIAAAEAELARARERVGDVLIRSPADGSFLLPGASDLLGRFVRQGERVGYVVGRTIPTARVVVPQSDVALVRNRTERVEVRLSRDPGRVLPARIVREVPAATQSLPSRALGVTGGGRLAVDPTDPDGLRTLETIFQLDLKLPEEAAVREIGGRVYVRFDHGAEPLALRGVRELRRLFLRRVGV